MGGTCCKSQEPTEINAMPSLKVEPIGVKPDLKAPEEEWPVIDNKIQEIISKLPEFKWDSNDSFLQNKLKARKIGTKFQKGEWEDNMLNGRGYEYETNGTIYLFEGYFEKGKKHGRGRMIESTGSYYEGEFKSDFPDGFGNFTRIDGMRFEGNFKGFGWNFINGKGKYYSPPPDNSIYEGEFQNGYEHGTGQVKLPDGSSQEGSFVHGNMTKGKMQWPDKTSYVGDFKDKKFDGTGRQFYSNGQTQTGSWSKGAKDGEGILEYPDGTTLKGRWNAGEISGIAILKKGNDEYEITQEKGKAVKRQKITGQSSGTDLKVSNFIQQGAVQEHK